jgi:Putative esterase
LNGKIDILKFESKILQNNPLEDPYKRDIIIYTPPNYSTSLSSGHPAIFLLPSFGNDNYSSITCNPFSPPIHVRLEKLIADQKCGEMIIVMINCFNRLGGSQYINSVAVGRYQDYIIDEIIPFIDLNYNISKRAILGKSSGGFGALSLGMRNPGIFNAVAAHSFDSAFEYCYLPDFPIAIDVLRKYKGAKRWLIDFWNKTSNHDKKDFTTLSIISMAAHYSPNLNNPDLYLDLPFDIESGEFKENIWKLWREFDPINKVSDFSDNLKKMELLYFDCGINDEFNLIIGSRIFSKRCKDLGINHEYMEFEGGHFNTGYRYDTSLQQIWNAIG